MPTLRLVVAIVFFIVGLLPQTPVQASSLHFAIAGGQFFTEAGGGEGLGYAITDDGGVRFWSEFNRLGGVAALGYPASWRFVGPGGFVYQATQAAVLQWRPEENRAVLANAYEMVQAAGLDGWLAAVMAIPPGIADDGSSGDLQRATAIRLGWLTDQRIRRYYLTSPNPLAQAVWETKDAIALYGLPMSPPQREGPFLVQRFQRVALQLWLDAVPGMPAPGTVVKVLTGDVLKEAGLIPVLAAAPLRPDSPLVRVDPGLRPAVAALQDDTFSRDTADILLNNQVRVVFAPLPENVAGMFLPSDRTVTVNTRWGSSDVRAIADVLTHEASHARDYLSGRNLSTPESCFATEIDAFASQARLWAHYFGPEGKQPALDALEQSLNSVLVSVMQDRDAFERQIRVLYQHQCTNSR